MKSTAKNILSSWSQDLPASVVVFLVALPLCMGIAVASGVPPARGLVTGMVGGIVVGFIAGSPLQVSGPAAGLAVVVYQFVQVHGLLMLGPVLMLAGAIQITAGVMRMGQWFRAVSPAVIHGMLAGIGVLIFGSQFHVMVDDQPRGSGIQNLLSIPEAVYKGVFPLDGSTHHIAAGIGLLTIVTIMVWPKVRPKKLHVVPGVLIAVVVAAAVSTFYRLPIRFVDLPNSLADAVALPSLDLFTQIWTAEFLTAAAVFAFVASAETLLCATAVDQMQSHAPRTKYDRELTAQGVGNAICGFFGALPMTGVIVRSSANVEAGGRTRMSAIYHGVWLLGLVAFFPAILQSIPTAGLAAVLVYTGYKLVSVARIRELATQGRWEVVIYAVTLGGIVIADLLTGVLIGIGLAVFRLVYMLSHLEIRCDVDEAAGKADLHLKGAATFVRLPQLAAALEDVPDVELRVHLEDLAYIDHACIELLSSWEKQHHAAGGKLAVQWDQLRPRREEAAAA